MKVARLLTLLVVFLVVGSGFGMSVASTKMPYRTGAILVPLDEYSKLTGFHFIPVTAEVYKHLIEIAPSYPRRSLLSKDSLLTVAAPAPVPEESLPNKVNNSDYLPPIGNQGLVGSCNAWASTYYVWTYMINWFRNNTHPHTVNDIMNPTFTYNLINDGEVSDSNGDGIAEDHGSLPWDAMSLIGTIGAIPYGAFRVYNGLNYGLWNESWNQTIVYWYQYDHDSFNSWLAHAISVWPEEPQWWDAPHNRGVPEMYNAVWGGSTKGIIYVIDLTNQTQFNYLKGLLAAGYIAETAINVYDEFMDFDTTNNIYALNQQHSGNPGGHAVTIVGYDDNITTPDGQGALLMVNSWGTNWGDHGYWWLTYQAAQDSNHELSYGKAFIFVPKEPQPYQPKILARLKITHDLRGEIIGGTYDSYTYYITQHGGIELGAGDPNNPLWTQWFFNFYMGYQSSASDLANYQPHPFPNSSIVLDLTDSLENLSTSSAVNSQYVSFYIRLADKYQDGVTGNLDLFQIIVNSTYIHRIVNATANFPVQIPEDGNWLTVSAQVPIVDYAGVTPLDRQKLSSNNLRIEIGSIVNMTKAVLHFGNGDYNMTVDSPYHAFFDLANLSNGTYNYTVSVILANGNTITLPQRTVYVNTSIATPSVPLGSSQWVSDDTIAPGETAYSNGTFTWRDVNDSETSPFTGKVYDLKALQLRYDSSKDLVYMKIDLSPLDNLGSVPAPLIKVYFDTNGDGAWDYYAIADLAKKNTTDGLPAVLDLYDANGTQLATQNTLFVPSTSDSAVFLQIPGDLLSISGSGSMKVRVELYEHDDVYGPLDVLNTSNGGDSADVDLQQVPVFSNVPVIVGALFALLLLFRRR